MNNNLQKLQKKYVATVMSMFLVLAAPAVMAQTTTPYDGLTAAVDWSDVGTSLVAVGVAVIGIFVVFKGIKLVVRMVKGA